MKMGKEAENMKTVKDVKLRVWPGVAGSALIVIGLVLGFSLTITAPDAALAGIIGAIIGALVVVLWWLFFSRARWFERWGAIALLIAAWFAMRPWLDRSITGGA